MVKETEKGVSESPLCEFRGVAFKGNKLLTRADVDKLCEVGALELVDLPAFGELGSPEVYRVTLKGEQLLREWDYPIDR